jgi:hypothetical protein
MQPLIAQGGGEMPVAVRSSHALIYETYPVLAEAMAARRIVVYAEPTNSGVSLEVIQLGTRSVLLTGTVSFDASGLISSYRASGGHLEQLRTIELANLLDRQTAWTSDRVAQEIEARGGMTKVQIEQVLLPVHRSSRWLRFPRSESHHRFSTTTMESSASTLDGGWASV